MNHERLRPRSYLSAHPSRGWPLAPPDRYQPRTHSPAPSSTQVVYARAFEQQKLSGCGRMLAVGLGLSEAEALGPLPAGIEVACVNSPRSIVLAGR